MRDRIVALAVVVLLTRTVHAEEVLLDPPVKVAVAAKDGTPVAGRIVAYDEEGFRVEKAADETATVAWGDLHARDVLMLHRKIFAGKGTAEQWLVLGRRLSTEADPKWADQALREAVKLDLSLKDRVAELKASTPAKETIEPAESDKFWGRLTDEESRAAIDELKTFAREGQKTIGHSGLDSFETDYFLFVTDLDPREAKQWAGLLDKMYNRLLEMFAIPPATNIWHGKAMVFVFKKREDFVNYESKVESYQAAPSVAGLCHQVGPVVRIAFYRQPEEKEFAHVLVHESVHGFLHRYRKPEHIPSWINEGLAEWIAYDVLKTRPRADIVAYTKVELGKRGSTDGMFETDRIDTWHYPVAHLLTEFMIAQNKRGYVAFINAVKDGKDWPDAMEEDYGTTLEKLVPAFGQSLRLQKPLKP